MSRILFPSIVALSGLLCACASDVWFKPGAGPDALAKDKASCREQTASELPDASVVAFERCMEAREWWHLARGADDAVALGEAASGEPFEDRRPLPAPSPQIVPSFATARPERTSLVASSRPEAAARRTDIHSEAPLPGEGTVLEEPPPARERASDPAARQFWFKWGAGTQKLAADQSACRTRLGLEPEATSPSRWGESRAFDRCMRERGWTGGSIESRSNR